MDMCAALGIIAFGIGVFQIIWSIPDRRRSIPMMINGLIMVAIGVWCMYIYISNDTTIIENTNNRRRTDTSQREVRNADSKKWINTIKLKATEEHCVDPPACSKK